MWRYVQDNMVYAAAEFGSSCRNDSDHISDRDLLVVCDQSLRYRLVKKYSSFGFSVSCHSFGQLVCMQQHGSLFIQHLKDEAIIRADPGALLERFLVSCDFVTPAVDELRRCEETLFSILYWPDQIETFSWKADFLYCAVRDYLIKRIAVHGIAVFGLHNIGQKCNEIWGISKDEFCVLEQLRRIKANHRAGRQNHSTIYASLFEKTRLLLARISRRFNHRMSSNKSILEYLSRHHFLSPYHQLRVLECAYLVSNIYGIKHYASNRIHSLVSNPNFYHSSSKYQAPEVQKYLTELVCELTTNKSFNQSLEYGLPSRALQSIGVNRG